MSLYARIAEEKLRTMSYVGGIYGQEHKTTFTNVRRIEVDMHDNYMDVSICYGPSHVEMKCVSVKVKSIRKYPGARIDDMWIHPLKVIMTSSQPLEVDYDPEREVIELRGMIK